MSEAKGQLSTAVDDDFLLDDIEDMPGFVTPPTGSYTVRLEKGIEDKIVNDAPYYNIPLTITSVMEVLPSALEEGETLPKEGDMTSLLFKRDNEFGMSNFKQFVKSIAEKFNARKVSEIRAAAVGLDMVVVIKRKYDKKNDRHNLNIVTAAVL
jgi:hypothetical protein